jgi:hypothetical protein
MKIKEFLKTYVYHAPVLYDKQYLELNGTSIEVDAFSSENNMHPITGEVLDHDVSGFLFVTPGREGVEFVALIHEESSSEYDWYTDFCEEELR